MPSATHSAHTVKTTFNYYLEPDKGGVEAYYDGAVIEKRMPHVEVPVNVTDLRGQEEDFDLDKSGFQVLHHPSVLNRDDDDATIKKTYYAECAELIKKITGATRVDIMSHIVRRQSHEAAIEDEKDLDGGAKVKQPATARFVHVDQSYRGAQVLLELYLPEEAERLSRTRWAIINFWRPLSLVQREPLGLCDARSVAEEDLYERPLRVYQLEKDKNLAGKKVSSTEARHRKDNMLWSVKPPEPADRHRWYYWSRMTAEEAILIKIFDSKDDGTTARRAPHSAFASEEDCGPPRESLETRCLVFWEDEANE